MYSMELLDIVDETGTPIGVADRERIHREGLLHRAIHVWLLTPTGELIFQRRSSHKNTWPDKLDATVGGHVGLHEGYEAAALRELREETGVIAQPTDLHFITRLHNNVHDPATGVSHNALGQIYVMRYDKPLATLRIDKSEAFGFEAWPVRTILHLSSAQRSKFVPVIIGDAYLAVYRDIKKLVHE